MDTCFNCGAAVRPGAKFCTSCGTRLIDNSAPAASARPEGTSWSQTASTGETQTAAPAVEPAATATTGDEQDNPISFSTWRHANGSWAADRGENTGAGASPADRFEAALDTVEEKDDASSASSEERAHGWGSPARATSDRFASWSVAYGTNVGAEEPVNDESQAASVESVTIAGDSATGTEPAPAGFAARDTGEPSDRRGHERMAAGDVDSVTADQPSDDPDLRQRATTLVEELRELIWKIGEQEPVSAGDMTEVRNALSAARGSTADYSDLQRVISTVRHNPRDIDALVQLGGHAGRLEELLQSHARLTSALDDAISKMQ